MLANAEVSSSVMMCPSVFPYQGLVSWIYLRWDILKLSLKEGSLRFLIRLKVVLVISNIYGFLYLGCPGMFYRKLSAWNLQLVVGFEPLL
jgi:hypothetical protein